MDLKKLFIPVNSLDGDEAKAYFASHREGEYTLLDVRQPWEYEDEHLPGARLIPLPQLPNAYQELDPEKPTVVHCAVGGRSRVAAQMLSGLGFKEVYNLAGGIKAFEGPKAAGPQELDLDLVRGDEPPAEVVVLAYGMEKALQLFYEARLDQAQDQEMQGLFAQLSRVEQQHQQRLLDQYRQLAPAGEAAALPAVFSPGNTLEGGFKVQEFMEKNESYLDTVPHVLDLAMMLETQALDLYLRLARRCSQTSTREVLWRIADEEKAHLASLGRLLEAKLKEKG